MTKTASTLLLLTAAMILLSCGSSQEPEAEGQQTYSIRSDPDVEFVHMQISGSMAWQHNDSVVFGDGRFRHTNSDQHGNAVEVYEIQLSEEEVDSLLELIVESGLMKHDHKKTRIAEVRYPLVEADVRQCHDCGAASFTIQLAEDNCPGRGRMAPISARVHVDWFASTAEVELAEVRAASELTRRLSEYRKRAEPTRLQ